MALFKATQVRNKTLVPAGTTATDIIWVVGDFTVPAGFTTNDVVEMGALPGGYVPVDLIIDHVALGATVTANFGLLSGVYDSGVHGGATTRTVGTEFATAQALQTPGIKRSANAGATRIPPTLTVGGQVAEDRGFGFVATAVTTPTVGATIRCTLLCRPASDGV